MFNNQQDDKNKSRSAKQMVSTKSGAERRQRQLMSLRHKTHGEKLKQLRGEADFADAAGDAPDASDAAVPLGPMDVWAYDADSKPASVPLALLDQFVNLAVNGQTREEVFQGTMLIRKILSVERDPPYDQVVATGVVPRLIALLERGDVPELQFEAAWALTNVAAGTSENTVMLVELGAIPRFVALLSSPNADCRDQAAWALGNLAGEGAACRDEALRNGAMPALLELLRDPSQPPNVVRNATWAASNLCRCKPQPALELVAMALPAFALLLHSNDTQLVVDATWGISYISDGPQDRVQAVLETGVLPTIISLLSTPSNNLRTPAIRIIGNIAAGNDAQTQMVINGGALNPMAELLRSAKRALRKETCWTISNIAAGPVEQIQALISANVYVAMLDCLQAPELDVRKEAVWSVSNVTMCGTVEQVKYLVNIGVIQPLCDTLQTHDPKIVTVALEALQCFLQVAEDEVQAGTISTNIVAHQVQECGGVDHIENLQRHANRGVYTLALAILETFFAVDGTLDGEYGGEENGMTNEDGNQFMGNNGNNGQPFSF